MAIDVSRRSKLKKIAIFSDLLSSLQAIDGFSIDNDQLIVPLVFISTSDL